MRVQLFPTEKLKIEPWFINGWQSYGRFNNRPGIGGQILYRPNGSLSILGNQYGVGQDALGVSSTARAITPMTASQYKYLDRADVHSPEQGRSHPDQRPRLRKRRWRKLHRQRQGRPQAELPRLHGLQPVLV